MVAFIICALMGLMFVGLGIYCFKAKKPMGFFANADAPKVEDVKRYNRDLGILWIVYGVVFTLLCIPVLNGQNAAGLIITILGVMFEAIIAMGVYMVGILPKYEKQ